MATIKFPQALWDGFSKKAIFAQARRYNFSFFL